SKEIIAAYGGDQAPTDEVAARKQESLSWVELPGGMTRVRADLSPGDAAVFAHAIEALAKPRPGTTSDGDAVPKDAQTLEGKPARTHGVDQRSPGKRRADALMELINAGTRASEQDGGRVSVKATITIPLSVLIGSLVNAGHAVTALGQIIDAGTARALACSARLVPMVIGTQSQPLDIGRATRCFHPATRQAIVKRDRGCTFPGCDRPAPWCEAHHAVPWWVNGRSDLANGTLLCSRHHHLVHAKGYLPWIGDTEVVWDLVPGRMPTQPLPPDDPLTHGPGAPPDHAQTA
ncbi:HNH endonuclease signature motif containing protein, partial [Leekyejoonella antrihumi]